MWIVKLYSNTTSNLSFACISQKMFIFIIYRPSLPDRHDRSTVGAGFITVDSPHHKIIIINDLQSGITSA